MSVMDLIVFAEAIHHVRKFRRNTGNSNITEALQSSIICQPTQQTMLMMPSMAGSPRKRDGERDSAGSIDRRKHCAK